MSSSIGRFNNWNTECENAVNKQICLEYEASLKYHLLFSYFNRDNVALDNIADFFNKSSVEEREHAHQFILYQNKRGGIVELNGINSLDLDFESEISLVEAFELAIYMEQKIYENLLEIHKIAENNNDPQFADYIESNFLAEQIDSINKIAKYISQLNKIDDNEHGIWHFDQNFK